MNKLLSAGFARMFKSKLFLVLTVLSALFGAGLRLFVYYGAKNSGFTLPLDCAFFAQTAVIGIVMAVFCSMFFGIEYSDGTIRNKLVVGHSRSSVYISNLILGVGAGFIFTVVYYAFSLIAGIPLLGFFEGEMSALLLKVGLTLVLIIAYVSIYTLISMTDQSKASAAVISIILAFVLFFASVYIYNGLNQPEFYEAYEYTENGVTVSEPASRNPNYLTGTKREVYEVLFDVLPGCQASRIGEMYEPQPEPIFAAYSLLITLVTTAAGIAIFKKKNIK